MTDSHTTGSMYATIRMMYCATCVQVTARMPPRNEQTRIPARPAKIPISKARPVRREVIRPTP
ncbi:hypothetical protein D3C87_1712070 [compost metagenome]